LRFLTVSSEQVVGDISSSPREASVPLEIALRSNVSKPPLQRELQLSED